MEKELIDIALENMRKVTGAETVWKGEGPIDGVVDLIFNNITCTFVVEVKGEVRSHNLHQTEEYFKKYGNFLLVAQRIFPKVKEELRIKGVPYLEANGNIFINKENLFLYVDTQKRMDVEKNKGNRAFTQTGLKVLFYFLQNKDAINLTQRELATKTNVGLGNMPQIIKGLRETNYLIPLNNKTNVWENRKDLLDRWITEYASVLRPKLKKGRYTLRQNWQNIQFEDGKTVWGGEPAADLLTNHLRPEKFVIYTKQTRMELMRNYKLIPDNDGEIEVLEMFWEQEKGQTAPPMLVYVDLMLEEGKRNRETAEKIYNEHIQPIL